MKTSNRILVGIALTAVVVAFAAVAAARVLLNGQVVVPLAGRSAEVSSTTKTTSYDFGGFTGVSASGAWELTIQVGSHYTVSVSVPENLARRVSVHTRGTTLVIGLEPGTTLTAQPLKAEITTPALSDLQLSGANRVTFTGFAGRKLTVECSGAAEVTGAGRGYQLAVIKASGASSVMFRDLPIVNAEVTLSGAGHAELRMNGGRLSGRLSGAARVTYSGTVAAETIETSGIASVTHR